MQSVITINHDFVHELVKRGHISKDLEIWLLDDNARREHYLNIIGLKFLLRCDGYSAVEAKVTETR